MIPVFEEVIAHQSAIFAIPFSTVIQCQESYMLELANNKISNSCRFGALFPFHSDSNICSCYHIDIISTIANSHRQKVNFTFDKPDNILFLGWGASITDGLMKRNLRWDGF
jgi:hypothetical protein